jgi:carotenoid cleavage dioxygenase-like enzyme
MPPSAHPFLTGNLGPISSEDDFELQVRGSIPAELEGTFYRNGPNPQFVPETGYHPFLGDGMIHAFFLEGGRARYRNRWIRTPRWLAENKAGRALFGGLGRPSDPSVEGVPSGGANTHIVSHAGRLMALQEGSEPFELDPRTLDSLGFMSTGGRFTAHPKLDPETGELVWFAYSTGDTPLNPMLDYGVTDASGRVLRRDRFAAPYCSMVHDFLVTRSWVLFPILPLTGDPERAKRGGPAFAWEPQKGAYLGVMRREASVDTLRWLELDPSYVFHPMNAWEDGSRIHADVMEYPTAPLFPRADGGAPSADQARLVRWTIDLDAPHTVKRTPLDDLPGEFPRVDERFAGLPYRHGWYAANLDSRQQIQFNALAHIDLQSGARTVRSLPAGHSAGEPVFVPRSPDAPEGDGFVLTTIHRAQDDRSALVILDAQNIACDPIATCELPRRVPVGFHASWVPAQ